MLFGKEETNAVKGIAVILLLMHHVLNSQFCDAYKVVTFPFSFENIIWFAENAKVCVAIFVFLTAYGITKQYNRKGQGRILERNEVGKDCIKRYVNLNP